MKHLLLSLVLVSAFAQTGFGDPKHSPGTIFTANFLESLSFALVTGSPDDSEIVDAKRSLVLSSLQPVIPRKNYIGTEYFKNYANENQIFYDGPVFDGGLIPNMDVLAGSQFNPKELHPLVREAYENTSRFKLHVSASSGRLAKLVLTLSNQVAEIMGNSLLPLSPQKTDLTSQLDHISFEQKPDHFSIWNRTYAENGKPALIGLYHSFRFEDESYVVVLFPYLKGNQLSVLRPTNLPQGGLRLTTENQPGYLTGDYYTKTDSEGRPLSTRKFTRAHQVLEVFVDHESGELKAKHSFLGGNSHLTLHYTFERDLNKTP